MKKSTKVLIGVGTTVAISGAVIYAVSDSLIGAVSGVKNRYKVKQFVQDSLNGNEKILDIVDDLSDDEIASVANIIGKIKEGRQKITVTGNNVKEATDEAKRVLMNFVEGIM